MGKKTDAAPTEDPVVEEPSEVEQLRAEMATMRSEFTANYNALDRQYQQTVGAYNALAAGAQPAKVETPNYPDPTDDEVATAMESGDYKLVAKLQRQQAEAISRRTTATYHETEVKPLMGQVRDIGMPAIASLTKSVVTSELSPKARELYETNKDQVHQYLAGMPAEAQLNAEAIKGALAYAVGQKMLNGGLETEIQAEAERMVRGNKVPGIHITDRAPVREESHNWEDLFGAGTAAVVAEIGGWDVLAARFGYENIAAYARATGLLPSEGEVQ